MDIPYEMAKYEGIQQTNKGAKLIALTFDNLTITHPTPDSYISIHNPQMLKSEDDSISNDHISL